LDGYKSEIRFYWIWVPTHPRIVLMYPNATVRRTSELYGLDDLENPTRFNPKRHFANVYQQLQNNSLVSEDELKWTLPLLEEYLIRKGMVTKGWTERVLQPMALNYLRDVFFAAQDYIPPYEGEFAFFGVDLLMDENLGMHLLEVQIHPGMSSEGVKKFIIPPLVKSTVSFIFELRERKRYGLSLCSKDFVSIRDFMVIYNEADAAC